MMVRAEVSDQHIRPELGNRYRAFYGQVGVRVTEKLMVIGEGQRALLRATVFPQGAPVRMNVEMDRDVAAGVRYSFSPLVAVKAEQHWYRGFRAEDPEVDLVVDDAVKTTYTLFSLSVSF